MDNFESWNSSDLDVESLEVSVLSTELSNIHGITLNNENVDVGR